MTRPLTGIRVLDLTHFLSGPFCTMILGDLGAEVLKIEDPHNPDDARTVPPFSIGEQSTYYLSLNRSKKSVTLNLKSPEGLAIFDRLVTKADVVIDNFRPGVTARLKIDYPRLRTLNHGIICCSISGFGATGPAHDRPGYDYLMQALSGFMSVTGEPGLPPAKAGISIVDHLGGIFAAVAILAAVVGRTQTGEGRHIDLALLDCQLSLFSYLAANYLNHGAVPERQAMSAHPYVVPCQNFQAADGWFTVTAMAQKFWPPFCEAVGRPELGDDPRFRSREDRYRNREALLAILEPLFRARLLGEWVARLEKHGVPVAPVNDLPTALADPQVAARRMVIGMAHAAYGTVRALGNPVKMDGVPDAFGPPPILGEHTEEVLTKLLGYSLSAVADLRGRGAC